MEEVPSTLLKSLEKTIALFSRVCLTCTVICLMEEKQAQGQCRGVGEGKKAHPRLSRSSRRDCDRRCQGVSKRIRSTKKFMLGALFRTLFPRAMEPVYQWPNSSISYPEVGTLGALLCGWISVKSLGKKIWLQAKKKELSRRQPPPDPMNSCLDVQIDRAGPGGFFLCGNTLRASWKNKGSGRLWTQVGVDACVPRGAHQGAVVGQKQAVCAWGLVLACLSIQHRITPPNSRGTPTPDNSGGNNFQGV